MKTSDAAGWRSLDALWSAGAVADLTDEQLLERFTTGRGEAAGVAFAALVGRHGPMVLRTCRAVLRDEHDAQDAFQATFLVLVRRGRGIWVRDSVGPWLHRVALRAAMRARRGEERRRARERKAAEMAARPGKEDGLGGLVQEEVDRLPDRYRAPVVLCDLEGLTYEEAARSLGCPVGTVKSRLARARDRLRGRLIRRGFAPMALAAGASVPPALAEATVGAAVRFLEAGAASAPAAVAAIVREVLRSMILMKLKAGAGAAIVLALLAAGAASIGRQRPGDGPAPAPLPAPRADAAPAAPADPYAWRRTDVYEPPDFERFFPDDPEGGRALDALLKAEDRARRPAAEVLRTVRQGLRRMNGQGRDSVLSWIGGEYVWGKTRQDPDAVEILYHAADFRGKMAADPYRVRHNAVYYGLSVVQPKPPAILRTLAEIGMVSEEPNELSRIAWGAESQRDAILAYLKPFLGSDDPAVREKADAVERIFKGELNAFTWAGEHLEKMARAKYGSRIPELEKALRDGTARERVETLGLISREWIGLILDEPALAAFAACAGDGDEKVRREVARVVGQFQPNWTTRWKSASAVDLLLRLTRDASDQVRYDAVYHGLTPLPEVKREEVARRLLELAVSDRQMGLAQRIAWGLQNDRALATRILNEFLGAGDPERAGRVQAIYKEMTGREPPTGQAAAAAPGSYSATLRALHARIGASYPSFALKGIDWEAVGKELLPRAAAAKTEEEFGLLVEEMVARLEDTHAIVLEGTARPPTPGFPQWDPGFACTIDDRGRPVVYVVDPGSPAHRAGVRPGMAVVSVDGVPADEAIRRTMALYRKYAGYSSDRSLRYDAARMFCKTTTRGAKVALVFEDVGGRRKPIEVAADRGFRYLPRLPVPRAGVNDSANLAAAKLPGGIGYIYIRRIPNGLEAMLDAALKDLGPIRGLILDLRGNSGGGFDESAAFANFGASPVPGRPHYAGPIALLVDERTTSAGEGWASWFVAKKRARLFGTTTTGASCRKETYMLDNGLYRVVIPVKAFTGFLDRPIERRGLEPDVEVRPNARDLAAGRDTVAEAAAKWLATAGGR